MSKKLPMHAEVSPEDVELGEGVRFYGNVGVMRDEYVLVFTREAFTRLARIVEESRKK